MMSFAIKAVLRIINWFLVKCRPMLFLIAYIQPQGAERLSTWCPQTNDLERAVAFRTVPKMKDVSLIPILGPFGGNQFIERTLSRSLNDVWMLSSAWHLLLRFDVARGVELAVDGGRTQL